MTFRIRTGQHQPKVSAESLSIYRWMVIEILGCVVAPVIAAATEASPFGSPEPALPFTVTDTPSNCVGGLLFTKSDLFQVRVV